MNLNKKGLVVAMFIAFLIITITCGYMFGSTYWNNNVHIYGEVGLILHILEYVLIYFAIFGVVPTYIGYKLGAYADKKGIL
ncbi:MAG: hypothetical protein FWH29_02500 [Methanobrevibacter sp.]|nr:hypothetical protein [Methanobrevibacter sp.]